VQARESREGEEKGKVVVELKGVNVAYGREEPRKVLQDVDWTIREGERWVLAGHNGSSAFLPFLHPHSQS
jgi:ABC-type molybdenum transport system ATPase subunit/photorepair protein PhrA